MLQTLRWIFNYIAQVKRIYISALVLLVISVVTNLLITISQKYIIDDVFIAGDYHLFPYFLGFFLLMACSYIASWCFKDILFERASDKLRLIMRKEYMQFLYRMPVKDYQKERIGSFVSYLNEFMNSKNVYIWNFPGLIEKLLNLILLLAIVCYVMPELLVIIIPLSVIYIVQGKYFGSRIHGISVERNELKAKHNVNIEEGISSSREVIAFHKVRWEIIRLKQSFQRYLEKVFELVRLESKQLYISEPLRWGSNLLILGYGGYQVIQGNVSLGTFIVFYQFSIQLLDAIQGVYNSTMQFSNAYGGMYKAKNIIQGEQINVGDTEMAKAIENIDLKDISFSYRKEQGRVLDSISMEIPVGKKVAIIGESGSGKSTIAQLLLRFYEPDEGKIEVNHVSLNHIDRVSWAQKVKVVFQDPYLFPDTLRMNILMGRDFTQAQLEKACKEAEIHDTIMELPNGYDTLLGERGITLSGGQRQRIALARSIIGNPEILILDEATSALDLETERRVHANIDTLRKGRTTIIIAHRLSTVENADVRYCISQGKISLN
ncbi:ABC transporter ATP-binding protein [Paenibacillus paeoniae]|uniref:ABC transporter ATP-binding protein n=1 Tax=Paenibacillus paeoniae TaxID=2292705 RepID=A0A371P6M3_9BACL|nr:ABC transporter ATP-binding protein [Paenibacillus paeoniae]REK71604.1 ABC transporter ATP-binding protein [Paenibacillus paeoniae]